MNCRNFAVAALALTAMAFTPISACKKDGGGATGASADMLSYLPKDTSAVMGISWAKARGSEIFKKYESKILADAPAELATIKEKCGIDVLSAITTIVISPGKNVQDESDMMVAVKGNFDQAKIEECYPKIGGTVENGVYEYEGEKTHAYWPAKDTVLISPKMTAEQMKNATKDGSLKDNAEVSALVAKTDSGAALWGAGIIPPELAGMASQMGATPKTAYLTLNLTSGLDATIGVGFDSDDDAKSASSMITMGMSMAKGQPGMEDIVKAITTKQDGGTLVITAKFSGDDLTKMQGMAGGMGL